jgi:hypothetical protein
MNSQITVSINKDALLTVLRTNRNTHRQQYEKAWAGYCRMMREELEGKLERIKADKPIERYLGNTPPDDHTGDYDDVIDMLSMALGDAIELTQGQFKQYVKDDWGWKEQWTTSNTAYMQAGQ